MTIGFTIALLLSHKGLARKSALQQEIVYFISLPSLGVVGCLPHSQEPS
jgi:hypothetical protein